MKIERVNQLHVYNAAFQVAMAIFDASDTWPKEERYSLIDQIRRSSRSVCTNISEAWAKRRYVDHFVSKLTDAHAEAEETLTFLDFAVACGYLKPDEAQSLSGDLRQVIVGLLRMINNPDQWCLHRRKPD
jgi:four helix bundle protein